MQRYQTQFLCIVLTGSPEISRACIIDIRTEDLARRCALSTTMKPVGLFEGQTPAFSVAMENLNGSMPKISAKPWKERNETLLDTSI